MRQLPRTTVSTRVLLLLAAAVLAGALLAVCGDGGPGDRSGQRRPSAAGVPAPPDPNPEGECQNGWREPAPGTPLYEKPLQVIRETMRRPGPVDVDEMRFFEGPESPPSDKNYLGEVRRWYVKGRLENIAARWLVEARTFGVGVAAVAPYGTHGFRSPDWTAFQYETAGPYAGLRKHPGVPGRWAGSPYDFVTGEPRDQELPGEALTIPGLPTEVVGCLEGT